MARDPLIGTSFNGYTLLDMVGEGGTSVVYRATHPSHGTVAVKILREKLRKDKTALARFNREATLGLQIQHPCSARTLDVGEWPGGLPFLAIEWAPGELLETVAKREGPLAPDAVAAIVLQVADAVAALHQRGIVHRDLKPDNLMYAPDTRAVKLLDFGIAVATDTAPEERLTRAGFFVGTLMYVAPEALSGQIPGPGADQYSLATIAYYLLAGVLPYGAKSPREMFTLLLSQPPTPLNQARQGVRFPEGVERVVMKGLARAPGDRYPDISSFASALAEAIATPDAGPSGGSPSGADDASGGLFRKFRDLFGKGK